LKGRRETMDFKTIRELAKHHKQSFGRILKCEMYKPRTVAC
jgi:hypothetical protein